MTLNSRQFTTRPLTASAAIVLTGTLRLEKSFIDKQRFHWPSATTETDNIEIIQFLDL